MADDKEEYQRFRGEHGVFFITVHDYAVDVLVGGSALNDVDGGKSDKCDHAVYAGRVGRYGE